MGHTWREMDPAGSAAHDSKNDRILKLRKSLENMSLSEFTACQLKSLCRVMGVGSDDPNESDMVKLEQKLRLRK